MIKRVAPLKVASCSGIRGSQVKSCHSDQIQTKLSRHFIGSENTLKNGAKGNAEGNKKAALSDRRESAGACFS